MLGQELIELILRIARLPNEIQNIFVGVQFGSLLSLMLFFLLKLLFQLLDPALAMVGLVRDKGGRRLI